jgi:transketolase
MAHQNAPCPTNGGAQPTVKLDPTVKQQLANAANIIRGLSMDAIQKANSGHPGLPMGCAEIGAYLYGYAMRYSPKNSQWANRDSFILSAGHGSMLLYSCLHLAGYEHMSIDELKRFRQLHSHTPGHPESLVTPAMQPAPGVETTTGPLGQGVGHAVGHALSMKLMAAQFNTPEMPLFNNKVFCLMGDGCAMEGVSSEACSLAGHLQLDNLILIYDANNVSLDGPLSESCSENTRQRYEAYGWEVYEVEGHDLDALHTVFSQLREHQTRPALVIARTLIGKGSPHKAGSYHVHGSPLGVEEVKASKEALGLPLIDFYVPEETYAFFRTHINNTHSTYYQPWQDLFEQWSRSNSTKRQLFDAMNKRQVPADLEEQLTSIQFPAAVASRKSSQMVIQKLSELLPYLYGGSADLSSSDLTMMKSFPLVSRGHFEGRNIKYGVREFAMATIATGLSQSNMIVPFIGTFATFSDYMRNAIRLSALMRRQVVYQFTHDSIFLGEDGPTHQPVEHYAALRAIPHLQVIRPADAHEVCGAWLAALNYQGPTALLLSRQDLPTLEQTKVPYSEGVGRGAYILEKEEGDAPEYTLFATGSEVWLALDVAKVLRQRGKKVRVISMPCWKLFEEQSPEYRASLIGGDIGRRISIEAGVALGWHQYIGHNGIAIALSDFGASAPYKDLQQAYGFTVDAILGKIL